MLSRKGLQVTTVYVQGILSKVFFSFLFLKKKISERIEITRCHWLNDIVDHDASHDAIFRFHVKKKYFLISLQHFFTFKVKYF